MKRNSSRFSIPLLLLAPVLAVTLTLALAGVASAAPLHFTKATQPVGSSNCLNPAPPVQEVGVGQQANVDVTVQCDPNAPGPFNDLYVSWGDGTTSTYPVCVEVCPALPVVIPTSHKYAAVGDYHPLFCPSLAISAENCPSVEVIVSLLA